MGVVVEILGCACNILSCKWNAGNTLPFLWRGNMFVTILLVCTIGGALIGGLVGAIMAEEERRRLKAERDADMSEKAIRHRRNNAELMKKKTPGILENTNHFNGLVKNYRFMATYELKTITEKGWVSISRVMSNDAMLSLIEDEISKS